METSDHITYMRHALALARRAEGRTSPNPMVGAVIVKDGRIISEGYHHQAGQSHAEIEALHAAGDSACGAAIYVNLEPCAHHGRTPPCTNAIIAAGLAEVYYAIGDPNPRVNGKGHAQIEAAGINVHRGLCEKEAHELNRPFFKHVTTGKPFVTAKFAMSLDGKIATRTGDSHWITNSTSRQRCHQLRNVTDVILVGAGTVLVDDPQLTTRLDSDDIHHPVRIVADSSGRVPLSAKLFNPTLPGQTIVATTDAALPAHCAELSGRGVEVWRLPSDVQGRVSLTALLDEIGRRGMLSLLVEGGSELLGTFFAEQLVDRVWAFIAPVIIGGRDAPGPVGGAGVAQLSQAIRLCCLETETLEGDMWIRADVESKMEAK